MNKLEEGIKFTFTYEVDYQGQPKQGVNYTTTAVTLPNILADFEQFLRGCGFAFDGQIDIVGDNNEK